SLVDQTLAVAERVIHAARAPSTDVESESGSSFLIEHDLIRKSACALRATADLCRRPAEALAKAGRFPPRIKSRTDFFGIMLCLRHGDQGRTHPPAFRQQHIVGPHRGTGLHRLRLEAGLATTTA